MGFSISQDWSNYLEKGWENVGRSAMEVYYNDNPKEYAEYFGIDEKEAEEKAEKNEIELEADDFEPMMNYYYPLELDPTEEKIIEVCKRTNCTVMYKEGENSEDIWALALTGGGMNLSQDIALAYMICEKWIPKDLLFSVCTQPALSVSKEDWNEIANRVLEQIGLERSDLDRKEKEWKEQLGSLDKFEGVEKK